MLYFVILFYLNSIVVHFIFIVKHFFWIFKIYFFLKKYIDRKQQSKTLQVSNINGLNYILVVLDFLIIKLNIYIKINLYSSPTINTLINKVIDRFHGQIVKYSTSFTLKSDSKK